MESNTANIDSTLLQQLLNRLEDLTNQVIQLQAENVALRAENTALRAENAALRAENAKFKEMLGKNSRNSSKPPSSDGYSKPAPKSQRQPSGRKQGAQPGHPGKGLSIDRKADTTVLHLPQGCKGCPQQDACLAKSKTETRTEIDIQLISTITAHKAVTCFCPKLNNQELSGRFPDHIRSSQQYGHNLTAFVAALATRGTVSIGRIHELLSGVFNIPISTGTVHKMVKAVGNRLDDVVEKIRQCLIKQPIINCDETGLRVAGKLFWVHNASNELYTHLTVHEKRGKEGMDAAGVLAEYEGITVHDFWRPYWLYLKAKHAVCNSHLLRELKGQLEAKPEQTWLQEMIDLLIAIKKARDMAVANGQTAIAEAPWQELSDKYDQIVQAGKKQNPILPRKAGQKGRSKRGPLRALADRFYEHKDEVLLFARDFAVPFTNNLAEQDVRMTKVKAKVSGCFRTKEGAVNYLKIKSYLKTTAKHGFSAYQALRAALNSQSAASDLIFQAD